MIVPRHVPPAHSPLPARALAAGLRAALAGHDAAPRVRERVLRERGAADAVLTGSGTAALTLALRAAAAARPRAPAALPAYGCYDLATAALGAGVPVVLYDVDPATLAPEPASLSRALAAAPCALVCAHLFGVPVDVDALLPGARAAGALLVEDAAQGLGASVRGRPAGGLGPVSILSFGRGKGMTGGAGGALLATAPEGADALRRARRELPSPAPGWRDLAGAAAQWLLARPSLFALPSGIPSLRLGETVFHSPAPPASLSRAAAAALGAAWDAAAREVRVRQRTAARLHAALHSRGLAPPVPAADACAGWLRLPIRLPAQLRLRAESPPARRLGVARAYPLPLCDLDGFRPAILNGGAPFPGARELADSLFTLPTHSLLREADLRALEAWIAEAPSPATREGAPIAIG